MYYLGDRRPDAYAAATSARSPSLQLQEL
jgi:hypothetical protein